MRRTSSWIKLLVNIGVGLVILGLVLFDFNLGLLRSGDAVVCGQETMRPEDRCREWLVSGRGGSSGGRELSYEEVKADNAADRERAVNGIAIGSLGLVLIVSCGIATLARRS
ncbi:hypothetical protein [Amycolatopsis sp. WGS_07]|uniref:hypothetical protein n=1 Tax=Amycolatopsis sp. WGS_07 TaxID=3076764 RepID=UPI003873395D